jgi:acyl dehydratase
MEQPSQVKLDQLRAHVRELVKGPITRTQLALFAGASGDHNPIHLDDEAARQGGLQGVIAHGMLIMAFLGDLLVQFAPIERLREFDARFVAMSAPGDTITCRGEVTGTADEGGETVATVKLAGVNQKGQPVIEGQARFATTKF